ncbi:hypothetical protein F5X99DRAFT_424194 [Biscogniauxia marginata]|nr:hypothetical protein F5X99DRAFT_424194 [Biscogniauxia marginata]
MATVLGKRKSRTQKADPSVSQEDAMAVFRRHFEAQFKPLEPTTESTKLAPESQLEDMRSDSESSDGSWGGVSDEEEEYESETSPSSSSTPAVEVVSHTNTPSAALNMLSKRETKAYLSSRPPTASITTDPSTTPSAPGSKRKPPAATADEDAPSLVRNDLALQRLLSESHLLAAGGSGSGSAAEHRGRNRHLATDLRMAALGSKASIYAQAKMPMAHRKGIAAAAGAREARRRREARENGIVLERPGPAAGKAAAGGKKKKKDADKLVGRGARVRRERPVGAPAVGRLSGGTLRLSRRDIAEIEADGARGGGGAGKKRRR